MRITEERNSKRLSCFFSLGLMVLVGCGGEGIEGPSSLVFENAKAMVAEAKSRTVQVSIEDFKEKMESEAEFLLIDVRESNEFEEGNIPGSFNVPRGILEFKIASEDYWDQLGMYVPEKDEEIITYCKKGGRGALSTESLTKLGYTNCKNLTGGWIGWSKGPDAVEEEEEKKEEGGCG